MTDYAIQLRPEPGDVPAEIRLRRFLKDALRRHGLRAVDVRTVAPDADRSPTGRETALAGIVPPDHQGQNTNHAESCRLKGENA